MTTQKKAPSRRSKSPSPAKRSVSTHKKATKGSKAKDSETEGHAQIESTAEIETIAASTPKQPARRGRPPKAKKSETETEAEDEMVLASQQGPGRRTRQESADTETASLIPAFPQLKQKRRSQHVPAFLRWLMNTRAGHWLADLQVEEHGKRRLVIALLIWNACCMVNVFVCNYADIRRAKAISEGQSLKWEVPDLGHGLIPHVTIPFFPDYFVIALTIPVVIMTLRNKHRLMILRRFFYVHGMLCLFRSLTILVTTLPDPSPRCQVIDRPVRKWYEIFNPLFNETCGDLMFSGHTVMIILLALVWNDYFFKTKAEVKIRKWSRVIVWLWTILGIASLLAARYHYTIDVLIAAYAAHRTWRIYGYIANSPELLKESPLITLLERRSSEGTMDEWTEHLRQARLRILDEVSSLQGKFLANDTSDSAAKRAITSKVKLSQKKKVKSDDDEEDDESLFSISSLGEWLMDSII